MSDRVRAISEHVDRILTSEEANMPFHTWGKGDAVKAGGSKGQKGGKAARGGKCPCGCKCKHECKCGCVDGKVCRCGASNARVHL